MDADHEPQVAKQDMGKVLPRLKGGGVRVFADMCDPKHPEVGKVLQRVVGLDSPLATWACTELGYGVAVALQEEA